MLLSGSDDGIVCLWDVNGDADSNKCLQPLNKFTDHTSVVEVCFKTVRSVVMCVLNVVSVVMCELNVFCCDVCADYVLDLGACDCMRCVRWIASHVMPS